MSKLMDMRSAIADGVSDGQSVYLGGFTHLIPFAAGHEIIRQGVADLNLIRATPDVIYDRMIAAGCASKVTFSWAGNPGVGTLRAFRRAVEEEIPNAIELDEYSHQGLVTRLAAGAQEIPFLPLRTFDGTDIPEHSQNIRLVDDPFGGRPVYTVPALNPDVAIVRAQRADERGNAHLWGVPGEIVEAAFAADTVILSVEELVDERVIRSDPNRTLITEAVVDRVVVEPYGSHPSYAQGYYDRDNRAYLEWDEIARSQDRIGSWLEEWVYGVENHTAYLQKLGAERLLELGPQSSFAEPVNVGRYA